MLIALNCITLAVERPSIPPDSKVGVIRKQRLYFLYLEIIFVPISSSLLICFCVYDIFWFIMCL